MVYTNVYVVIFKLLNFIGWQNIGGGGAIAPPLPCSYGYVKIYSDWTRQRQNDGVGIKKYMLTRDEFGELVNVCSKVSASYLTPQIDSEAEV